MVLLQFRVSTCTGMCKTFCAYFCLLYVHFLLSRRVGILPIKKKKFQTNHLLLFAIKNFQLTLNDIIVDITVVPNCSIMIHAVANGCNFLLSLI